MVAQLVDRVITLRRARGVEVVDDARVVHAVERDRATHGSGEDVCGGSLFAVAKVGSRVVTFRRVRRVEVVGAAGAVEPVERYRICRSRGKYGRCVAFARVPEVGYGVIDFGLVRGVEVIADAGLVCAVERDGIVAALGRLVSGVGASLQRITVNVLRIAEEIRTLTLSAAAGFAEGIACVWRRTAKAKDSQRRFYNWST